MSALIIANTVRIPAWNEHTNWGRRERCNGIGFKLLLAVLQELVL